MQTLVLFIILLVCFSFLLKQTYRKWYSVAITAIVCALFVGLTWPYAIEQSKLQINGWLANQELMLDIAVLLSVDVQFQLGFCILAVNIENSGKLSRRVVMCYRFLRWFPGILFFPILFSILVTALFAFPGIPFAQVAWGLAAILLIAIPAGSRLLRYLLPEKEIRLELLFLTHVLIALLGVIATVNGHTHVEGMNTINLSALLTQGALAVAGGIAGLLLYRHKIKVITLSLLKSQNRQDSHKKI